MEVIRVTRHAHMLGGGSSAKQYLAKDETCFDFLNSLKAFDSPVRVWHNEKPVGQKYLQETKLKNGDTINLVAVQNAEAAVAFLVEAGISSIVAGIIVNIGISLAVNFLISTVFGPSDRGNVVQRKDPEGYGLTGGSNQARQFAPVPVVMGRHRIFPDYCSPWVVDYVTDINSSRQICNATPVYETVVLPDFKYSPSPSNKAWDLFTAAEQNPGADFSPLDSNPPWGSDGGEYLYSYGEGTGCGVDTLITYRWQAPALGRPWTEGVVEWTTSAQILASTTECQPWGETGQQDCPPAGWRPLVAGVSQEVVAGYGYAEFETTQRLSNIYNYGFGDLVYSDHYIGTTKAESFRDVQIDLPVVSSNSTSLLNWRRGEDTSVGPLYEYPANTESVDGGELYQNGNVAQEGWVIRESSRKTSTYLEVDFAGRLFRNGPGGAETLTRTYDCEYRIVGSGAWVQAPGFPVDFSNGDTTPFRKTMRWDVPSGRYEVRVKKTSPDESDAANICDVVFERFKSYVYDPITTYPAINRVGVQILASGQLNGALDRWSSIVSSKCWVFEGVYTGSSPGGAGWTWKETSSPAWWLLYFSMGGFLNESKPKGWHVGYDSANGERLFGAGLQNHQIDFASIVAFDKWCTAKNLKFNAVVDSQRPCADVMIDIATAGRGSPTWSSGKLGVVWADPSDIPSAQFGMGNIIAGSFEIQYQIERRVDEFVASYNDENDFFISRQVRAVVPGVTNPVNSSAIQFFGITTEEQAQREVNLRAADIKYHIRKISFDTSMEGMVPQRGDVILLAHDLTAWAFSGRLNDISADGKTITLSKEIHDPNYSGDYWMQIRLPNGELINRKITAPSIPTGVINLTDALPDFEDHFPEDYIFQAGPSQTPGKRCRVLSIEPAQNATVKIICTDDYLEYYANEFTLADFDAGNDENLTAKIFNAVVEKRDDGNWLCWESVNCRGAQISASINNEAGVKIAGTLIVPGLELKLPNYASGTTATFSLLPDDVVSAKSSLMDVVSFTF
jgi:hypothetical protein